MRRKDVIAFASRDWKAIAASKRRRWADQRSRMDPADALRVGDELRQYARSLREAWPTDEDRRDDLAAHVRVSESLGRVRLPDRR